MTDKIDPIKSFDYIIGNGIRNSLRPLFTKDETGLARLEEETDKILGQAAEYFLKNQEARTLNIPITLTYFNATPGSIIVTMAGHVSPLIRHDDVDDYYRHLKVLYEHPQWKMPKFSKRKEEKK